MKKLLTILFILCFSYSFSQPVNGRSNASVTVMDSRWMAQYNAFLPRYLDTVAATAQRGVDSLGAIIYTYTDQAVYIRANNGGTKYWKSIVSGGGGGVSSANNGNSLSGSTVQLGGSSIIQPSAITLVNNPLTFIKNGVNYSGRSDSTSLFLANNTAAATSTDSLTSPMISLLVNSRKTLGGSASQPVEFNMFSVAGGGGTVGSAKLYIQSKINNGTPRTFFQLSSSGSLDSVITYNGAKIRLDGTGSNLIFGGTANLSSNTSGLSNTAIGVSSLIANTTGNYNVAVGQASLGNNTGGQYNTAVGFNALGHADSSYNTAIGYAAMQTNTTGNQNTAVGTNSMFANTIGIKNTAIGAGSLENNTSGSFNSIIGEDGLLHNTTGGNNSAVGWLAGSLNDIGSNNVSIGYSSARSVQFQNKSVFIGESSGYLTAAGSNLQKDSCYNCIAIGSNSYAASNNEMRLGNDSLTKAYLYGVVSGLGTKAVRYDPTTKQLFYADTTTGGSSSIPISSLLAATANNSISNTQYSQHWDWGAIPDGYGLYLSASTTGAGNNERLLFISTTGANSSSSINTYGGYISNTHSGTSSTNTGLYIESSGASNNYSLVTNSGAVGLLTLAPTASALQITIPTTTATTTASGIYEAMNSLTSGTGSYATSSSLTSGNMFQWTSTSTALAANNEILDISMSGANGTSAITATGARISVTNTNATSGTNVGLDVTASGATTANVAVNATGDIRGSTLVRSPIFVGSSTANGTITIEGNNAGSGNTSTNANIILKTGDTPTQALDILNNGMVRIGSAPNTTSGYGLTVDQPNDAASDIGINVRANNHTASTSYGYGKISASGALVINVPSTGIEMVGPSGGSCVSIGTSATAPTSTLNVVGSFGANYRAITALRTLDASDYAIEATANTFTVTLPTAVGIAGRIYVITNSGSGTTTLGTTSSQTFVNVSGTPTSLTLNQFNSVTVVSNGANWLRITSL